MYMDDRSKTLAALTVIVGSVVLIVVVIGVVLSGKKVISPVPEESAIRIIFVSPSPSAVPSTVLTPTPTKKS
jgi:hypothetical protein